MKNGVLLFAELHFVILIVPKGHQHLPLGKYHIAPAIYHISARKYITFPTGKISLGVAKTLFATPFPVGLFFSAYPICSRYTGMACPGVMDPLLGYDAHTQAHTADASATNS